MKLIKLFLIGAAALALASCSNAAEDEAKRLGFSSASEMEEVQSKGWHTNAQYRADEGERAKRFGFTDIDELHRADRAGVKTKTQYDKYVADLDASNAEFAKEEAAREAESEKSTVNIKYDSDKKTDNFDKVINGSISIIKDTNKYCASLVGLSDAYLNQVSKNIGVQKSQIKFVGASYGPVKGINLCGANIYTPIGKTRCSVSEMHSNDEGKTSFAFLNSSEIKLDYVLCEDLK